jgi:pyruvate kinase
MLSGETSVGKYPVQAVKYMAHILQEMERWQLKNPQGLQSVDMNITKSPRRALANAAVSITRDLGLLGLFVPTSSGSTAAVVSAYRPISPIFGICSDIKTARLLMLHWGVTPCVMVDEETADWEKMIRTITSRKKMKLTNMSVAVLAGFGKRSDNNQPVLKIIRF